MANDIIERNRQIGLRFVEFISHGGDPSTLFAPNFVYYDAQGNPHDPADTMRRIGPIRDALPDRTIEIEEEIVTEDRVVIRWRRTGTFRNDAWGFHATGNSLRDVGLTALAIDANGLVSQVWEYWDLLNFFMQLGIIQEYIASISPAPAPTSPASAPTPGAA